MHVTQTMEDSGPGSEKRLESRLVSQLPAQWHGGGARVPQQGSQWGKKPKRKFKVLCLFDSHIWQCKEEPEVCVRNKSLGRQDKD